MVRLKQAIFDKRGKKLKPARDFVKARPLARKIIEKQQIASLKKRLDQRELKNHDTTLSFNVDSTMEVPASGQLALIPQNDTANGRDGRKADLESIFIKMQFAWTPGVSPAAANAIAYIWLVVDHSPNKATAPVSGTTNEIFDTANAPTAMMNLNNDNRYTIIKKWTVTISDDFGAFGGGSVPLLKYKEEFIKFKKPIQQLYDASTADGAITSLLANALFLVVGSDTFGDDTIAVSGRVRVRFRG